MVSLAPLLRKTAGCGFAFGPCLITLPVCYVAHSSASAEMAGYRAKALDGTSSAYDETTANQRFSSPNIIKLYTTNNCPDYIGQYSLTVA